MFEIHRDAAARATRTARKGNGPVTVITVHRAVWEAALEAANGDAGRIEIISATEVVVRNTQRGHSS